MTVRYRLALRWALQPRRPQNCLLCRQNYEENRTDVGFRTLYCHGSWILNTDHAHKQVPKSGNFADRSFLSWFKEPFLSDCRVLLQSSIQAEPRKCCSTFQIYLALFDYLPMVDIIDNTRDRIWTECVLILQCATQLIDHLIVIRFIDYKSICEKWTIYLITLARAARTMLPTTPTPCWQQQEVPLRGFPTQYTQAG